MFWFSVLLNLVDKHRDVLFEIMIASPRSHASARVRQTDHYWDISKFIDKMKEKIWEVGKGPNMNKYEIAPAYDPAPISNILRGLFHELEVVLVGLMRLETDLFRFMTEVEHLRIRLFLAARKVQCERFWRCLMATCWNSEHARELAYFMNPGGWLNQLMARLEIYKAFERGPRLLIPAEPIEDNCFICLEGLNEWVDYESKHVPDILTQRPFPPGQVYLTTAPPTSIMKTRCCAQAWHKRCMVRAVAKNHKCLHCRVLQTVEDLICLCTDWAKKILMVTMAMTKHLANPEQLVKRWAYRIP